MSTNIDSTLQEQQIVNSVSFANKIDNSAHKRKANDDLSNYQEEENNNNSQKSKEKKKKISSSSSSSSSKNKKNESNSVPNDLESSDDVTNNSNKNSSLKSGKKTKKTKPSEILKKKNENHSNLPLNPDIQTNEKDGKIVDEKEIREEEEEQEEEERGQQQQQQQHSVSISKDELSRDKSFSKHDDFMISINDPKTFNDIIEILSCIVGNKIQFIIIKTENFEGIAIEYMKETYCVLQAKFKTDVEVSKDLDSHEFALLTNSILSCFKCAPDTSSVVLTKKKNSDSICARCYNSLNSNGRESLILKFELKIIEDSEPVPEISVENDLYNLEIPLDIFKKMVNCGDKLSAKHITFTLSEPKENGIDKQNKTNGYGTIRIDISGELGNLSKSIPTLLTENYNVETDSSIIKLPNDDIFDESYEETLKEKFSSTYGLEYIKKFIKSMNRTSIEIRIGEKSPIIINYKLGDDESFIRFILSPAV